MQKLKLVINLLILLVTTTLLAQPYTNDYQYHSLEKPQERVLPGYHDEILQIVKFNTAQPSSILTFSPWDFLNLERLSSDRIFDFTEMIENTENLEEVFSENELTAIEDFFIYLARNGIRDWDVDAQEELEEDIAWLVEPNDKSRYFPNSGEDTPPTWITPFFDFNKLKLSSASLIPSCKPHITLCKSKSKKPFKKIKQFIKKHKKAIIIGAVVVVAVVVITIATQGTGTAPALAAGSGGVAGADNSNKKPKKPVNKPGEVPFRENESDQHQAPLFDTPHSPSVHPEVSKVIDQKTNEMKETLNLSLSEPTQIGKEVREVINDVGSFLTHQAVDAVDEFLKVGPQLCEAMKEVGERVFPDGVSFPKFPGSEAPQSPIQKHDQTIAKVHEAIDRSFGTNQADLYTPEAKALKDEKITTGVLPPPGNVPTISSQFFEKNLKHIFRKAPGHLIDTPANRKILLEVAGNSENFLGVDKYGNAWHAKTQKNGQQIWTMSRDGAIRNAGSNNQPKPFQNETGLSQNQTQNKVAK